MNKSLLVTGLIVGVGLTAYVLYKKAKPSPISASSGRPINAYPARNYALNNNFNPNGSPPTPTFTPFSGVPIVESILKGWNSGFDTSLPDYSSVPDTNSSLASLSLADLG